MTSEKAAMLVGTAILIVVSISIAIGLYIQKRQNEKRRAALKKKRGDPYSHIWKEYT